MIAVERAVNGGVWITYGPVAGATELTDTEGAWAHGDLRAEGAGSAVVMGDVSYGAVSPAMLFLITGRGM